MNNPKRIPYGMMNFVALREENCYYVDKTRFVEEIEHANMYFFYIRPRRFGKSLTLSMLRHYYDVNEADKFETWFKGLYIGEHPTPLHNSYLVLYFNFSVVNGEISSYRESMDSYCNTVFTSFCEKYSRLLPEDALIKLKEKKGAVEQLYCVCDLCDKAGQSLYLFIDEYDHFTNTILSEVARQDDYASETHGTGYLRSFYNAVKSGTDSSIKRVFLTGVSPVTMDDLTSGFNIGTNYSLDSRFNEMTGFTEVEVRAMLQEYSEFYDYNHSIDELIQIMKPWYDNYCFAKESYGKTTMYNSNMVLYFMDKYLNNGCVIPEDMLEENIRIDYNKLRMLIRKDKNFTHDASVIQDLVTCGFVVGELKSGFPAERICEPDNFISLLYYFGLVTIAGTYRGKTRFVIPNEVVREQVFKYLLDTYDENGLSVDVRKHDGLEEGLAYDGNWKSYFQNISDTIYLFSSQRDKHKGESFVHGFTLAMTCQNQFYRPVSEYPNQEGYADIFLLPLLDIYKDIQHSYVVELKYVKSNASEAEIEVKTHDAEKQVCKYAETEMVRLGARSTHLHRIVIVYRGVEMVVCKEL